MSTRRDTWEAYVTAWNVPSAAEKAALLETCASPACVYRDPLTIAAGHRALVDYMCAFQQQVPGGHFVTTKFFAHHDASVAAWRMLDASGIAIGEGISHGQYGDDGALVAMRGFFDVPAP